MNKCFFYFGKPTFSFRFNILFGYEDQQKINQVILSLALHLAGDGSFRKKIESLDQTFSKSGI